MNEREEQLEHDVESLRAENRALYASLVERRIQLEACQADLAEALRIAKGEE